MFPEDRAKINTTFLPGSNDPAVISLCSGIGKTITSSKLIASGALQPDENTAVISAGSLSRLELLQEYINGIPQTDYPCQSRVHTLNSYSNEDVSCYVKREDELGFGISGSKIRKYRTLIPYLIHHDVEGVVVIGSAYSNHVLGLSQLLIENQINTTYFLRGDPLRSKNGNSLLSALFMPKDKIRWFSKTDWKNVNAIAHSYAAKHPQKIFVLPEGGSCSAAFPGTLTLPLDICKNETEQNFIFDHIFIDSGTGLMASALILGSNWLKKKATIHVVLMAEDESAFKNKLNEYREFFNSFISEKIEILENFKLYIPGLKKFGQTNQMLFQFIADIAQTEGFLTDPIYSAKLFLEAKKIIAEKSLKGKILIIHCGGAITLTGFSNQLNSVLDA